MSKISKPRKDTLRFLEIEPRFRERRNKNRGIGHILKDNHPSLKDIPKEVMEDIVFETLALDRAWRWWLKDGNREDLRGNDYNGKGYKEKKVLEQEHMIENDYSPTHYQDTKKLSTLT